MPAIPSAIRPAALRAADRPLLGVLLMLAFCVLIPVSDGVAKLLGATVPIVWLAATRFGFQAVVLVPLALLTGRSLRLTPRVFRLTALRTLLHVAAMALYFEALRHLPLADATAISFVMPFILLVLGRYVLDEAVGTRRLAACAVGFLGTLMVVQPSFAEVGAPALLPLLVAVIFAVFMLVTRQIARDADPIALQATSGAMAMVVLVPALMLGPAPAAVAAGLAPVDLVLLTLLGVLGTVAHLLMTWSLRYAPSATLAPMQYLEIPFATLVGWLMFDDLPNGLAGAGIVVTVAAGLYVIHRERPASFATPANPAPPR